MKLEPTPEEAADLVRLRFKIGLEGPIPDLLQHTEREGIPVFIVSLPEEVEGACQVKRGVSFVLINQDKPVPRKRFTLAHELGHIFLGHGARLDTGESLFGKSREERDANAFAAALLMPRKAVDSWVALNGPMTELDSLADFSLAFGVSAEAACYRFDNLRLITTAKKRQLMEKIGDGLHKAHLAAKAGFSMKDSLYLESQRGGHIPFTSQGKAQNLAEIGLLSDRALTDLLRIQDREVDGEPAAHNGQSGR